MKYVLIAAAVLLILVPALSFGLYLFGLYSPRGRQNIDTEIPDLPGMAEQKPVILDMIAALNRRPYERVEIRSDDGLRLAGRYYHTKDGAPLSICFHGYRGTPSRDFSGGTSICFEEGQNLLMIEQRAQVSSGGHTITLGVKERMDCLAWIRYAEERFGKDVKILLNGVSMGAATVLMAAEPGFPESVKGIIADCPFTSPMDMIKKMARDLRLPASLSWGLVWLGVILFGHVNLYGPDACRSVKNAKVPILLIHGEADSFVPCEMSRRIYAAAPERIEFHTFPGAGHGLSYLADQERYKAIVKAFSKRALSE